MASSVMPGRRNFSDPAYWKRAIVSMARFAWRWLVPQKEAVKYEDVYLPAKHLRFCTTEYKDDGFLVRSAEHDVGRIIDACGVTSDSSVLDVGSGQGRLAIGFLRKMPGVQYLGLDVDARSIAWCQRHIARYHANFRFERIDAQNARYNPGGKPITDEFRLPCRDGEFQAAFLYSVFTHMMTEDVATYLRSIRRALKPGGSVWMTAYLEDGVPDVEENPPGYLLQFGPPVRPLHRVRFQREFFEGLIRDAGLQMTRLDYQSEPVTGQSVVVAECIA